MPSSCCLYEYQELLYWIINISQSNWIRFPSINDKIQTLADKKGAPIIGNFWFHKLTISLKEANKAAPVALWTIWQPRNRSGRESSNWITSCNNIIKNTVNSWTEDLLLPKNIKLKNYNIVPVTNQEPIFNSIRFKLDYKIYLAQFFYLFTREIRIY